MSDEDNRNVVVQSTDNGIPEVSVPTQELPTPRIQNKNAAIRRMLMDDYDLRVISLDPLDGYYDLNFHVTASRAGKTTNPYIKGTGSREYFLKIANLEDSKRPGFSDAVAELMEHLRHKGIVCQETIRGVQGQMTSEITSTSSTLKGEEVTYLASLRTFLPGQVLAGTCLTPDVLYNLGRLVAETTLALQDFYHPLFNTYDHLWNITNCPKFFEILHAIKDTQKRNISRDVLYAFQTQVLPSRHQLRTGQIHGDFNENNVLISPTTNHDIISLNASPRICGLLDLQDTVKSHLVYDLAICAAHMIMAKEGDSESYPAKAVPIPEIPGHILAGYESILELRPVERQALRICIAARLVTYLVGSAHAHHKDPGNGYLTRYSETGWEALSTFWSTDPAVLESTWDQTLHAYRSRHGGTELSE